MRFGTSNLDLVGVQEVRWDRGGTELAGMLTIFLWKWESQLVFLYIRKP
jgi:hypothetical protein